MAIEVRIILVCIGFAQAIITCVSHAVPIGIRLGQATKSVSTAGACIAVPIGLAGRRVQNLYMLDVVNGEVSLGRGIKPIHHVRAAQVVQMP